MSTDGSILAVGAPLARHSTQDFWPEPSAVGHVYIFAKQPDGTWDEQAMLEADNAEPGDDFGTAVTMSADGSTIAVGAPHEDSNEKGILEAASPNNDMMSAGSVYIYTQDADNSWVLQVVIKPDNTQSLAYFGQALSLSGSGDKLVVGSPGESSGSRGVFAAGQSTDGGYESGAVYVFTRDRRNIWRQETYLKADDADSEDRFGQAVAVSKDGRTIAAGAPSESSDQGGIRPEGQLDSRASDAGAVYVFSKDLEQRWVQDAYIKPDHVESRDRFGRSVSLSGDGNVLAVGSPEDSSKQTRITITGNLIRSIGPTGAVYMFERDAGGTWWQHAYIKTKEAWDFKHFGASVALTAAGDYLAVGAGSIDREPTIVGGAFLFTTNP